MPNSQTSSALQHLNDESQLLRTIYDRHERILGPVDDPLRTPQPTSRSLSNLPYTQAQVTLERPPNQVTRTTTLMQRLETQRRRIQLLTETSPLFPSSSEFNFGSNSDSDEETGSIDDVDSDTSELIRVGLV